MPSDSPGPSRVLVLLCTYNEVDNLPVAIERLQTALPQADILVVDDNSPDGTGRWVSQRRRHDARLHLFPRSGKLGLGTALRDGIGWCLDRDYEYLINLDADLSHDPADAPKLLAACIGQGGTDERDGPPRPCDVVLGSRYVTGGTLPGMPWHRRLISRALNAYATRLLDLPFRDCSGSFRCYRVAMLRRLSLEQLHCTGYGALEEILVHLHRLGAAFCELPIRFESRHSGRSKLGLRDALGALRTIHQLAFTRRSS